MASANNTDKRQRNLQSERVVQTVGRKLESYAHNRHDVDAQKAVQAECRKSESCTNKRWGVDVQNNAKQTIQPSQVLFLIQQA